MPQQPVAGAPQRQEALITQPRPCARKALITQSRPCVTEGREGNERIERYFQNAATHGVTGTYDSAAQSIAMFGTLGSSGGRGDERVAGDDVRKAASSTCPPRSPAVVSHASITTSTTLCFLAPSTEARFSGRRPQGLRRDSRHTVTPQRCT